MPNVGIFRSVFQFPSETFISEQAEHLVNYKPKYVCRRSLQANYPSNRIIPTGLRQTRLIDLIYAVTADPWWFGCQNSLRSLDLMHAHFGPDGVYAMELCEDLSIPLIVTFHGFDITSSAGALLKSFKPSSINYLLRRHQLSRSKAHFIAVSKFIETRLIAAGYPKARILQHYIGVDINKFSFGREAQDPFLLCVARHTEKKGLDILLKAFARIVDLFPRINLIQIGSGPLSGSLIQLTHELGLDGRVKFLGAQPHAKVVELMRSAYAFILPSRTAHGGDSEALGIVFNEASACGVPILSTWHGGIPEAVLHGETGLLAPENDDTILAENIRILLEDRNLAHQLGLRGRELVCDNFNITTQSKKLEIIYDGACGK
jgi:glycosyltransferase involved in cell wall biosynthesis